MCTMLNKPRICANAFSSPASKIQYRKSCTLVPSNKLQGKDSGIAVYRHARSTLTVAIFPPHKTVQAFFNNINPQRIPKPRATHSLRVFDKVASAGTLGDSFRKDFAFDGLFRLLHDFSKFGIIHKEVHLCNASDISCVYCNNHFKLVPSADSTPLSSTPFPPTPFISQYTLNTGLLPTGSKKKYGDTTEMPK